MRDAAREAPEGLELLRLPELLLELPLLGDVEQVPLKPRLPAGSCAVEHGHVIDPDHPPEVGHHPVGAAKRLSTRIDTPPAPLAQNAAAVERVQAGSPEVLLCERLLGRQLEQPLDLRADVLDVRVRHPCRIAGERQFLEEVAVALLRVLQCAARGPVAREQMGYHDRHEAERRQGDEAVGVCAERRARLDEEKPEKYPEREAGDRPCPPQRMRVAQRRAGARQGGCNRFHNATLSVPAMHRCPPNGARLTVPRRPRGRLSCGARRASR